MAASVLIVDDEENLLVLLDRILSKEGYKVTTARNGYDAVDALKTASFDLAILDIKMFPMDGMALVEQIKDRSPSTKVIMITAYPTVDSRNESFQKGASVYLTKPLDIQELKSILFTLLPS